MRRVENISQLQAVNHTSTTKRLPRQTNVAERHEEIRSIPVDATPPTVSEEPDQEAAPRLESGTGYNHLYRSGLLFAVYLIIRL
jgi:hypothetical protein